jgi:dTDP-4-dehydrorhamnose reductase
VADILITGGSGRLGQALIDATEDYPQHRFRLPSHEEMDILDKESVDKFMQRHPDIAIHCAAFANTLKAEFFKKECWDANIEGTLNIVRCAPNRLVYISTDYIFDGKSGNYAERDIPGPVNFYGLTKLIGESIARTVPNHLILRAPFRSDPPWRYPKAFEDQWTSSDFVSIRAPQILRAALSDQRGILHIGGPRRTTLELARMASPEVGPMSISDAGCPLPQDISLDCSKWELLTGSSAL